MENTHEQGEAKTTTATLITVPNSAATAVTVVTCKLSGCLLPDLCGCVYAYTLTQDEILYKHSTGFHQISLDSCISLYLMGVPQFNPVLLRSGSS